MVHTHENERSMTIPGRKPICIATLENARELQMSDFFCRSCPNAGQLNETGHCGLCAARLGQQRIFEDADRLTNLWQWFLSIIGILALIFFAFSYLLNK